jgi:hypothetical protein
MCGSDTDADVVVEREESDDGWDAMLDETATVVSA